MLSRRTTIFIVLSLMVCAALLWLYRPQSTSAQSEISLTLRKASPTPSTVQRIVIDPENSPMLTTAELSAQLLATGPGQPVPVQIHYPQTVPMSRAVGATSLSSYHPAATIINNWMQQMAENFEGAFPRAPCQVSDANPDSPEYFWDDDNLRAAEGGWSAWPAKGGANGLNPATNPYPNNANSWIVCGPFDLSQIDNAYTQFSWWLDIPDVNDYAFFGVSPDGNTFSGYAWSGVNPNWAPWRAYYPAFLGDASLWFGWQFYSNAADVGAGPWLDDIQTWVYDEPAKDCDALDLGPKGLSIPACVGFMGTTIPFLSDPADLDLVKNTGTHWARLEFIATEYGLVDFRDYDMIVDSLCGQDITTLAIVDYQTLARKDWNTNPAAYRNEFTQTLQALVTHFKNRVDYWEIWNEEDHSDPNYHVNEIDYADLLEASYQTVKAIDPSAKVVFGGTVGVRDGSRDYLSSVYQGWAGQSYLDSVALHPYFFDDPPGSGNFILDPQQYLHYDAPTYPTMLAKFLETMSGRGDSNKKIWTTEIGWNSAYGEPHVGCYASQVITRQLQADYLTTGFDILFNEVEHWNQPGTRAVAKVFWFGYQDFNILRPLSECPDLMIWHGDVPRLRRTDLKPQQDEVARPQYFGLYDGDRNRKPAFYNFWAYPARPSFIYLPAILKNYPPFASFATIVLDAPQPDGDNGWYVSDVEVSFTVPPSTTLPPIEYRLNLSNWQPFTMPFTVTSEGENLVEIRPAQFVQGPPSVPFLRMSMRMAGASDEEILSFVIKVDKSQPMLAIAAPQPVTYTHGVTFTLAYSVTDAYSGLAAVTATLDMQAVTNGQTIDTLAVGYGIHEFVLSVRDMAGHTASQSALFTVTTTISGLIDLKHRLYAEGDIYGPGAEGIVQSLDAKLEAAQRNVEAGLPQAAINILQAFIHEVEAQTDQHITPDAAQFLIEDAQRIILSLSGGQSTYTRRK